MQTKTEEEQQPAVAESAATAQTDGRSIVARMEAAAQLLAERRVSFTEAQERRFLERFAELVDIYEAEYPGEVPPLVRYNKDCHMEIQFPPGFHKRSIELRKAQITAEAMEGLPAGAAEIRKAIR